MRSGNTYLKAAAIAILGILALRFINNFVVSLLTFDGSGILKLVSSIVVYLGGILILLFWILKVLKKKPGPPQKNTDHGSAEWATPEQIKAAGIDTTDQGLWLGDFYRRTKQGHLITIAGSGAGKNACLIIPNLLVNPFGSYVVTDPKGENACITARAQKESGQKVYILDPWKQQERIGARHGIKSSGFNPFDFIKADPDELRDNCELVASYIVPDKPNSKEPFWDERARTLIKTCLMHIVTALPKEEHNFWTLYKMIRVSGDNWLGLLADLKLNDACDGLISIAAEEFIGMDQNGPTISGIRSNAQNATAIFESPQLRSSMEHSDFDPYTLSQGNSTVYVVIPERYLETHAAWLRLVIGLSLKAVNSRPNKRVNFLMDEFAVLGKMKDVQNAFAFSRGQNVSIWAFAQSLSQLKEIYHEEGMNNFLANAAVFQAFGVKDQYTKEYVSKWLGDATYIKATQTVGTSSNRNQGGSSNGTSQGTSYSSFGRNLLTPEEIEKTPIIITITEGIKFPIKKMGYWENRFDGMDWRDKRLDEENRKLLKAGKVPPDLREIFAQRADPRPMELV
ncbi:MAG: type IV secretory system conjugative DNA transfer family protein [Chitinophagaceae bacterium]